MVKLRWLAMLGCLGAGALAFPTVKGVLEERSALLQRREQLRWEAEYVGRQQAADRRVSRHLTQRRRSILYYLLGAASCMLVGCVVLIVMLIQRFERQGQQHREVLQQAKGKIRFHRQRLCDVGIYIKQNNEFRASQYGELEIPLSVVRFSLVGKAGARHINHSKSGSVSRGPKQRRNRRRKVRRQSTVSQSPHALRPILWKHEKKSNKQESPRNSSKHTKSRRDSPRLAHIPRYHVQAASPPAHDPKQKLRLRLAAIPVKPRRSMSGGTLRISAHAHNEEEEEVSSSSSTETNPNEASQEILLDSFAAKRRKDRRVHRKAQDSGYLLQPFHEFASRSLTASPRQVIPSEREKDEYTSSDKKEDDETPANP